MWPGSLHAHSAQIQTRLDNFMPMFKPWLLPPLLVASLAMATPAMADSMRCGSRLVIDGDSAGKLRSLCGEPASISRSTLRRTPLVWFNGRPRRVGYDPVEIPVETWEYNFGPSRLMVRVRVEDGLVKAIDTLGYGYP
jgi:hypothetical protein